MEKNDKKFYLAITDQSFFNLKNLLVKFNFSCRNLIGIVLLSVTAAGTVLMLILRPTPWAEEESELKKAPLQALKDSAKLFLHKETHTIQTYNKKVKFS